MADDVNARIGIQADTTQAVAAIRALQTQIEAFYASNKRASGAVSKDIQSMQANLVQSINKTGAFRSSMVDVTSATQAFTTALEKNKLTMGQTFKYAAGSIAPFGKKFRAEWELIGKVARERVKDLQTQYIKMGRDADGAMKALKIRPLLLDLDNFNTKAMMSAQRMQIFTKLIDHGSTQLLNFGKNTQWAGRQLMVGFTVPLTMLGTAAAKSFMDIEKEIIKLRRVYGDFSTTIEDTNKMVDSIRGLATEFTKWGVAVKDTISLASEAAAAGAQGADLVNQVTEATRLSVLGNIDQQKAYETTISVTNAFGIAAEDLSKKIDFLNAVENQTVTSIDDLTTAIPKAAPVIQQLGGNVEDLAFFLTAMKEGGINASEGANALKSGLASLINPTNKASEMLKGFGINIQGIVEANKGDVKGLVIDFAKALDTLNPLQRAQAIEQLFGKFQFSRLSTLFQNVIQDGTQAQKVLELTNASTKQLAILSERELAKVQDSTVYKFQAASEKFQAAIAPVGEQFLKMVTPLIEFGTKLLEEFNKMGDGTKSFVLGTIAVLGAIGPAAVMAFGLVANGAAQLMKMFNFLGKKLFGVGKDTQILGMQTDYMTQQMIDAEAAASALGQKHSSLIQIYSSESKALQVLATSLQRAATAQERFTASGRTTGTKGTRTPKKYAGGVFSVPGPRGAGDIVPAMLSPGEAVIPAKAAQKYQPLIQGMIAGNIPGFESGTTSIRLPGVAAHSAHFAFPEGGSGPKGMFTLDEFMAEYQKQLKDAQAKEQKGQSFRKTFGFEDPKNVRKQLSALMEAQGLTHVPGYTGATMPLSSELNSMFKDGGKASVGQIRSALSTTGGLAGSGLVDRLNQAKFSGDVPALLKSIEKNLKKAFSGKKSALMMDEKAFGKVVQQAFTDSITSLPEKERLQAERAFRAQTMLQGFGDKSGASTKSSWTRKYFGGLSRGRIQMTPSSGGMQNVLQMLGMSNPFSAGSSIQYDKKALGDALGIKDYKEVKALLQERLKGMSSEEIKGLSAKVKGLTRDDPTKIKALADLVKGSASKAGPVKNKAVVVSEEVLPDGRIKKTYASGQTRTFDNPNVKPSTTSAAGTAGEVMTRRGGFGKATVGIGLAGAALGLASGGGDIGQMIMDYVLPAVMFTVVPKIFEKIGPLLGKAFGGAAAETAAAGALSKFGVYGMIAAAVVTVGTLIVNAVRDSIKKQIESGIGKGSFAAGSADQLQSLSEAAGTVSATETARAEQAARLAGVQGGQISSFGLDYLGTDAGKKLQENVASAVKSGFNSAQIGDIVGTQLTEAIAQNAITKEQANSIAIRLGEAMNNAGIGSAIMGQITKLSGNGNNVGAITSGISNATMANFNATRIAVAGGGATYTPMQGGGNMAMASDGNTPGTPSEVFGAQVGFAVDAYAQNQRLLDIINAQYDTKVAQLKKQQEAAKTTAEQARLESKINALESERTSALDKQAKINEDNFQAMMDSIKASGKIDDLTIEALNAKLDKLYEAAPEMAVLAKDAMKKAFEGDNVKVGFEIASGQLDAVTAQKLVGLMADPNSGKKVQASYDTIISNSGDAAAIELAQALVAAGATDQQIGIVLEMAATGDIKSITTATELLSQLETFTGVNLGTSTQTIGQISDLVTALQEASKASADVNLNASGFEEANQFVQDLGLLDNLKAATKEQQISYIVSVETMIRSQNKYTQEFLDWQNQPGNAGKSFSDFVFAKLGSPSDFSSTESKTAATTVAGKFVQGGGGGTPVDKLQQKIDKRQKALDVIALKEDKINKKYDDRKEALQKIADLNKEVADQQKAQLGIAEALASGDIAGAARAMQAYQEQAAQNAMSQQNRALEQARQNELNNVSFNGMNRADLEAQLADLQMQMAIRDYNNVGKQTGGGGGGGYYQKGEKPNYVPDGYDPSGKWVWNGKDWKWQGPKLKPVINEANTTNTLTTAVGTKPVMPDVSGMESYVADALMESYNKRLAEFQAANLKWASDNLSAVNGVKNALGLTSGEMAKMPFEELKQKIKDAGGVIDGNVAKIGGFKISLSNLEEVLKTLKTNANNATNPVTYAAQALWDLQNSQGKSKGPRPKTLLAMGGMVKPMLYRGLGGIAQSMGTDSVPALLTPGEFVIKRSAVKKYGIDNLKAINSGSSPADSSSVYNYNVTINAGSNASADDIARTVMTKIKQVESQRVRGNRY